MADATTEELLQKQGEEWLECVNAIIKRSAEIGQAWSQDRAGALIAILAQAGYATIKFDDLDDDGVTPKAAAAAIAKLENDLAYKTALLDERWKDAVKLYLKSAGPQPDGTFGFDIQGSLVPLLTEHLAESFKQMGGQSFVQVEVTHDELGPLMLTLQRRFGEMPAQQSARLRKENEVLKADVQRLQENSLPLGSDPQRVKELTELPTAELIDRLRGIYRIPITDGLGKVDGSESDDPNVFQRTHATSSIQAAAAIVIERLKVNQRTPGTVDVCKECDVDKPGWDTCDYKKCPIKLEASA